MRGEGREKKERRVVKKGGKDASRLGCGTK